MTIPKITLTMLGTTRSGKSTYLLGMYAILSAGLRNYFVYAEDADQDLDLSDAWDLLCDTGELPPATNVNEHKFYSFVFKHGLTPLIAIDCMDYRGGAINDRADSAEDVRLLRDRLEVSDSIYLVLDGEQIGDWLADPGQLQKVLRSIRVKQMSTLVQRAVDARQARGLPAPALVLLITKADLVPEKNGKLGSALTEAVKRLDELVPVAYAPGVMALICPVQLGRFGSGYHEHVDVDTIDPVGLHRPLIFSLMHYLTEGVEAHQQELSCIQQERATADGELNRLRNGFMGGFFQKGRIADMERMTAEFDGALSQRRRKIEVEGDRIAQLASELARQPILRDGKLIL